MSEVPAAADAVAVRPKDLRFWLMLLSLCMALFLSALEFTGVATALPTITADLHGEDFVSVGSAYALASSAILPMTGGLAQTFGRRHSFLASIALFTVGSTICGAAKNMGMLIGARTIQGLGGGGIMSLTTIIIGDMVPLHERGLYAGVCFGLPQPSVLWFVRRFGGRASQSSYPPPALGATNSLKWTGSACSITIALTFGGINFPWLSAHILAPLVIGLVGLIFFIIYDAIWALYPLVPFSILANRTSFSGQNFITPMTMVAIIYFLPVYFQACKDADPISSAVRSFGFALVGPASIIGGISVKILKRYHPQLWIAWALQIIGSGLSTTLNVDTSTAATVGFCLLYGAGAGIIYSIAIFPVQAPLTITQTAHPLAFYSFMRVFAGVWGVTIGGAILQNGLSHHLPEDFLKQFPGGVAIAYSVIPQIRDLPQPLKHQVQIAFAESLRVVWKVLVGLSGLGLVSSCLMRGLPLHTVTDKEWDPSKEVSQS
ncbi:hypothetical protein PILCRDRAFT_260 [Piloderma croceum F 1598]|uniref:Major facilitator superfamily (MFS) profile domain-containing protein n=1 Tax=Piloderma croceum (strain F 1598) TaxID=765440 RepID=A0A0C3GNS7_PILCF|nr:hypothetical protein PILCRDRAFT_260 [Piloderma croceum F 1598]